LSILPGLISIGLSGGWHASPALESMRTAPITSAHVGEQHAWKAGFSDLASIFDSDQRYLGQVGEKTFYTYLAQHRHGRKSASVRFDGHKARRLRPMWRAHRAGPR
jgi:hypothetical protein